MTRIEKKFRELKSKRQKAFVAFITCGYPNLRVTGDLIKKMDKAGVDILELGVPFSDPLADGPTIQAASERALKNKVSLRDVLRLVKNVRRHTDLPICLLSYYNPIMSMGEEVFCKIARSSGVDGVVIPDLPPEEAKTFTSFSKKYGLNTIFFVAPTTSIKRISYIASKSSGFIYYVSLTGVTGARKKLPLDLLNHLKIVKKISKKPICVGFGISNPGQIRAICKIADGVIVGSAIVNKIRQNVYSKNLTRRVSNFLKILSRETKCIRSIP